MNFGIVNIILNISVPVCCSVVLISDLTMHEMEILPKDLQLCTDMASGVDSLGKFEWGDLVNLE